MSVKRYWISPNGIACEDNEGKFVRYEDYAALEVRCAALAAELSAIEAIHNDAVFITDEHYERCPAEVQKMIRSLAVMQIPAYQAFLAEVRAQGVEMFAASLKVAGGHEHTYSAIANDFATQIRKGVQP